MIFSLFTTQNRVVFAKWKIILLKVNEDGRMASKKKDIISCDREVHGNIDLFLWHHVLKENCKIILYYLLIWTHPHFLHESLWWYFFFDILANCDKLKINHTVLASCKKWLETWSCMPAAWDNFFLTLQLLFFCCSFTLVISLIKLFFSAD